MDFEKSHEGNPLKNESIGLEQANSFDELYSMLVEHGPVQGTSSIYTPEELRHTIEAIRHGDLALNFVTRSHGLRDTVQRLISLDKARRN